MRLTDKTALSSHVFVLFAGIIMRIRCDCYKNVLVTNTLEIVTGVLKCIEVVNKKIQF